MQTQTFLRLVISLLCLINLSFCKAAYIDTCSIKSLPDIKFEARSYALNDTIKATLDSIYAQLELHPTCKINIVVARPFGTIYLGWDRLQTIMQYLIRRGIGEARMKYGFSDKQNRNTISFRIFTDDVVRKGNAANKKFGKMRATDPNFGRSSFLNIGSSSRIKISS